jgi:hypothetical protein
MNFIPIPLYVDLGLSKITSGSKRAELFAVLENVHPGHTERLDLVRFLGYVGYDVQQVCDIIHYGCAWANYSENMTYNQVVSVFKWLSREKPSQHGNNNLISIRQREAHGTWLNGDEWRKRYGNRPMCALHYVSCSECPDQVNGHCGKVRE